MQEGPTDEWRAAGNADWLAPAAASLALVLAASSRWMKVAAAAAAIQYSLPTLFTLFLARWYVGCPTLSGAATAAAVDSMMVYSQTARNGRLRCRHRVVLRGRTPLFLSVLLFPRAMPLNGME